MRYLIFLFALFLGVSLLAEVPGFINFQGRLKDRDGLALEGKHTIVFRIYDAEKDGNKLWDETHTGVVVHSGMVSLLLGTLTPFDASLFDGTKELWLEVIVDNYSAFPRKRLVSVPFSMKSRDSDVAYSLDCEGCVTPEMLDSALGDKFSSFDVDENGNVTFANSVTVTGDTNVMGGASFDKDVSVNGDVTVGGLHVSQDAVVEGTLSVNSLEVKNIKMYRCVGDSYNRARTCVIPDSRSFCALSRVTQDADCRLTISAGKWSIIVVGYNETCEAYCF